MNKKLILIIFLIIGFVGFSQQQNLPLNREFNLSNYKAFDDFKSSTHTSSQPIIESFINVDDSLTWLSDSEKNNYLINVSKSAKKPRNFFKWMGQSLLHQNFLVLDTGNFYLTVDPLLNAEFGVDQADKSANKQNIYTNTRGLLIKGNIGTKFSFLTAVYENQSFYPNYISDYVRETGVAPGQGRVKNFKQNGFDYAYSSSYISYTPSKFLNLQLGNGKNFIGDGYRSLLLSDVATNYPYLKATVLFGKDKFQFTKLHASLTNLNRRPIGSVPESLFQRKSMSTHYLNWLTTKWLNVGLFESTIWQTEDSTGTLPFEYRQLNPIPFVNTISTGFNKADHSIVGLNVKIKLPFKTVLYHQTVYDGKQDETQIGLQAGLKFYAVKNLTLQAEYNTVSPSTYQVNSNTLQNYDHYNQALAHPLGTNFNEIVGIANYKYKRLFTQAKINLAEYNTTVSGSLSEYDATLTILQAHLGYVINPKTNLSFIIGATNRIEKTAISEDKTNYIYFSIKTSLRNLYYDF
ncbi:hypothetical protein FRY74_11555 [Vicingus serpentipes]|uniref:Gliding motility protein RemB n=1 Tax=Vicingus serpentipes TaxID=1926625 RepID=A0A5C6RPK6_9FLAO|nr:hypothetical protein [Vicingus serpentipes]TXB63885.1 hypothetical protein FRY74_11555 [Vicingus serpentipes]